MTSSNMYSINIYHGGLVRNFKDMMRNSTTYIIYLQRPFTLSVS